MQTVQMKGFKLRCCLVSPGTKLTGEEEKVFPLCKAFLHKVSLFSIAISFQKISGRLCGMSYNHTEG